jgi:hypothetical protein
MLPTPKRDSSHAGARYTLTFLAAATAALVWSCGDDTSGNTPCDTVFEGQCGSPCSVGADCPSGMHCGVDGCFAECTQGGSECGSGIACTADGRCGGGASGNGGNGGSVLTGGGGPGGSGSGGACGEIEVTFEPQTPTVAILIDQSGSMNEDFQGQQRWDVVYDALMDPTDGVVKQLESQVRFGLVLYTGTAGTCPALVEQMPPALDNYLAIDAVYAPEGPLGETPTGDSILAITPALAAFAEPGPKLIILATDGDPDRCSDPNGHDQVSKDLATDAVEAAYAQEIETVIIAVGNQVSQIHQQDMANAGKGLPVPAANPCSDPMVCAPTYEPTTKQAMIDAFLDIINGKRTCVFTLDGSVIPGKECDGDVFVNGIKLPCNDPNGWQLNSPTEIEFLGDACDAIENDPNVEITASWPCEAVSNPPPPK